MIKIKNLTKCFDNRTVLKEVSYDFPNNGFIVLLGDSGSGKTTLLNCIGGVIQDFDGEIYINNQSISRMTDSKLRDYRLRNIGYVFQSFNLLNLENVYQNVKLPLDCISNEDEKTKERRVDDVTTSLGIKKLKKQNVNKLSGGEKQRTAIARAIINSPSIILCDEPTGALDENTGNQILEILKKLSQEKLVIVATHDAKIIDYADQILRIEDGRLRKTTKRKKKVVIKQRQFFGDKFKHKKPSLPLRLIFSNSFHKIKAKKYRSLIVNAVLSLSLTGIGISFLISNSVSNKIGEAFSSLTNGNQIVMSMKNENLNTYNGIYSAPIKSIQSIADKYSYYLDGYGVTYLVNFEDFFKDRNEFSLTSTAYKYQIKSLSVRSINDYRWIENDSISTYPYLIESLEEDEIILGLNYVDMVNICYELKIQRNYYSLGEYIRKNDLLLTLSVENKTWSYDDEQVFIVKGIRESNSSCFYHYDKIWNQKVFENMMLLPSDDDDESYYPWEMHKIYYLKTVIEPGEFIDQIIYDEEFQAFTFERTSYSYHPLLCKISEICDEKRVLVYYTDKYAIELNVIQKLNEFEKNLKNYYFISDYGYASYASNMLSGFAKNVFVSLDKNKNDLAIDADENIRDVNVNINLPKGVISGNYLNSINGGLKYSTKFEKLLKGRKPKNNNEIIISKGLSEKLSSDSFGKELFISAVTEEYVSEDAIFRTYNTAKTVVVGIVDEEKDYLYHNSNWSISFFRDCLGISMFSLTPKAVVFELENGTDADEICLRYEKLFSDYHFVSPTKELKKSVNDTLEYAEIILLSFSVISIINSIILLGTVISLSIMESADDIKLLSYIGISKKGINSMFIGQSLIQGIIACFISLFEIIVVDLVISFTLGSTLGTKLTYTVSVLPLLIVIFSAIIISFLTSFVIVKWINK